MIQSIRFLKDFTTDVHSDVCCLSGSSHQTIKTFMVGEIHEFDVKEQTQEISTSWFKPRRKPEKKFTFFLLNENKDMLHPDCIRDVPADAFEIVNEVERNFGFIGRNIGPGSGISLSIFDSLPFYGSGCGFFNQQPSEGSEPTARPTPPSPESRFHS